MESCALRGCLSPLLLGGKATAHWRHRAVPCSPRGTAGWSLAALRLGVSFGEAGSMGPALENEGRASVGTADPTTEVRVLSTPGLIPKGDTFAGLSFEEPRDSGALLSLTHHTVHLLRVAIARVRVRDFMADYIRKYKQLFRQWGIGTSLSVLPRHLLALQPCPGILGSWAVGIRSLRLSFQTHINLALNPRPASFQLCDLEQVAHPH